MNYQEIIDELIKIESNNLKDNEYLLSAYLPAQHLNTEGVKKRLKSLFESEIVNKKSKENVFEMQKNLIDTVNNKIDNISDFKEGLAIFVELLVTQEENKVKVGLKDDDLWVISLPVLPERSVFLGKVFNIDQLIWIKHNEIRAFLIEMNQDDACLYKLNERDLVLVKTIENPYVEERGKGKNQSAGGTMTYNPQKIKIEKDKIEKARGLMNTVFDEIKKEEYSIENEFRQIVVIYTSYFTDIIGSFEENLSKVFSNSKEIIMINKNFPNEKEMKNEVIEQISHKIRVNKRNSLKTARTLFDNYVEGWEKVIEAANLFKIKTLFIKAADGIEGYISENLLYIKPTNGAKIVKNISPWLIKNVILSDGEIIVFKNRFGSKLPEVAAQLRY
jgi:hypothetical protein